VLRPDSRIFIAGHNGLVGAAIVRRLEQAGFQNLVLRDRAELDLMDTGAVNDFYNETRPAFVIDAAARVGGIFANNTYRAEFIHQNLCIQNNVIHGAWAHGVERLLFLGSSCIYPRDSEQPIREEYLLTGPLEETNQPYAVAKIAGVEMCRAYNSQYGTDFRTVMPTNLYGPGDNFDLKTAHVLPALIAKADAARRDNADSMTVWGSGRPMRELLYVDDLADACVFLLGREHCPDLINVGSDEEVSIRELAELVCEVVGFTGQLEFDISKPDGTPRKRLDCGKLAALGWRAATDLREGIALTYEWYLGHIKNDQPATNE